MIPMTRSRWVASAACATLWVAALSVGCADRIKPLDPTETHYGMTYAEWGVAWWEWFYETPCTPGPTPLESTGYPVLDTTGEFCAVGQSGDVWFLAGITQPVAVERTCTIPAGKAIFFPFLNTTYDNACNPDMSTWLTPDELRDEATRSQDSAVDLYVILDGEEIPHPERYRAGPSELGYDLPPIGMNVYNCLGVTDCGGTVDPSFSDGYWMMFEPLPPGEHTLHFGGRVTYPGDYTSDITYHLTVE